MKKNNYESSILLVPIMVLVIIIVAIFAFVNQCEAQINKNIGWAALANGVAGYTSYTKDLIDYDYESFKKVHPNANDKFWNPAISYKNKWKNNDPSQGPAFFGSTTIFVGSTDGKHLLGTIRNTSFIGGGILLSLGAEKKAWYWYVIDFGISYVSFQVGHTIAELRYKGTKNW